MKVMKKIFKYIGNIIFALFIIVIILSMYSKIRAARHPGETPSIFGYKSLIVLTGSMRPYIEPGDMIVVKKTSETNIEVGDVITYKKSTDIIVTHRVIEKIDKEGKVVFRTKGDANNVEDEQLISHSNIIGEEAFVIPYGGYVAQFLGGKFGLILISVIIFILATLEIKNTILKEEKPDDKKEINSNKDA